MCSAGAAGILGNVFSMAASAGASMSEYSYKKAIHERDKKYAEKAAGTQYGTLGIRFQQQRDKARFTDEKIEKGARKAMASILVRGLGAGVRGRVLELNIDDVAKKGLDASGKISRELDDAETAFNIYGEKIKNEAIGRVMASDPGPPPNFGVDAVAMFGAWLQSQGPMTSGPPSSSYQSYWSRSGSLRQGGFFA